MWRHLTAWTLGVFIAAMVLLAVMMEFRGGRINWALASIISGLCSVLFAARAYADFARRRSRLRDLQMAFLDAMQELVDDMARLSPGDLSVYVAARQQTNVPVGIGTTAGSPNHHVLVQMADLGLARPVAMEPLGSGPNAPVVTRYVMTPKGKAALGNILDIVVRRRRFFAAQAG